MDNKVNVLDHGYVRLVDHMGSDLSVVRAARVSYDAEWRAGQDEKSDAKLINYLWKNKHTTPFEAVVFTFEVMAPILTFRQWHRYRTQSYNELSARYKELPEVFYVPEIGIIGTQSKDSKQARDITAGELEAALLLEKGAEQMLYRKHCEEAFFLYRHLLENGWPRELARGVLPVATYSHMFTTMNGLNLLRFFTDRTTLKNPHAQYEIRVYANAMVDLVRPIIPTVISAWEAQQQSS
jgi:thymidylate synthase (FAD)